MTTSLHRTLSSLPLARIPISPSSSSSSPNHLLIRTLVGKGAQKKKKSNIVPAKKSKVTSSNKGGAGRSPLAKSTGGDGVKTDYFTKIMLNENKRNIEMHTVVKRGPVSAEEKAIAKTYQVETMRRHNTNEKKLEARAVMRELALSMLPTESMKMEARALSTVPLDHAFPLHRSPPGWHPPREIFDDGREEGEREEENAAAANKAEKERVAREAKAAADKKKRSANMKRAV